MFSGLKRAFGVITLKIKDDIVHIEGIPADVIRKDISKIWSNRVTNNLFESMDDNSFSVRTWFLIDLLYAIDEILKDKGSNASVRSLNKIKEKLLEETWLANTTKTFPSKMDMSKLSDFHFTPLEHQAPFFEYYDQTTQRYGLNGVLVAAAAGAGKAQPLNSLIKVPGGWKTMGDMTVGTEVIAADGSITTVTGVFPQGEKQIYKFTFYDGREVEACGDHLWRVTGGNRGTHGKQEKWEIVSTLDLIEHFKNPQARAYVQLIEPEDTPDIPLEMDPYTLGVILGDGGISGYTVSISKEDPEIREEIQKVLPDTLHIVPRDKVTFAISRKSSKTRNAYADILSNFGLMGKLSHDKFIPEQYLHGSRAQRLALLQGLLDTDGTVGNIGGTPSFCSTSEALARGVAYLVRSLGGIATVSTKIPYFTYLGIRKQGKLAYIVSIRYKKPSELFRLLRKKNLTDDNGQYTATLRLSIRSIEPSRIAEAQCISIEHPDHLYVTDGFVATHNTLLSLMTMKCRNKKAVIIISPANALDEVWVKTLNTAFKKPVTFWTSKSKEPIKKGLDYYVVTYEYLPTLLTLLNKIDISDVGIILDESHRFNTPDTLRTTAFIDLCKITNSKDVLWLSGTPIKALTTEVLSYFTTVDPLFTPNVIARFKKIFGVSSARATDMMANRLGISLFIVQKKTLGLPEPVQKTIRVTVPNGSDFTLSVLTKRMVAFVREREVYYATRKKDDNAFYYGVLDDYESKLKTAEEKIAYAEFRKNLKITIQCGGDARFCALNMKETNKYEKTKILPSLSKEDAVKFKDIKSIVKYVKLKIQGECLGRLVSRCRIDCAVAVSKCINYAEVLESTPKKTLIFTNYVEVINSLNELLPEIGLDARFVYAKTNSQLSSIIKEFDNKEEVNPLVATYASLSTAVPVTSASGILTIDSPFREYILNQAISRAWRVGQDTQVTVTTAILDTGNEPNISSRTVDILTWSASQVEAITGVKSPVVNTDSIDGLNVALEGYALASKATPEDMEANYMLALEDLLDENEDKPEEPLSVIPPYMSW